MESEIKNKIHWSFWLIGAFALLWNIGGTMNYLMQVTNPDFVASLPESHKAIINGRPDWATAGFAIGVIAGAFGCIAMLLRKAFSFYFFIGSFVSIAITMIHTTNVGMTKISFSTGEVFVMIVQPLLVAAILIWYSWQSKLKGWIK